MPAFNRVIEVLLTVMYIYRTVKSRLSFNNRIFRRFAVFITQDNDINRQYARESLTRYAGLQRELARSASSFVSATDAAALAETIDRTLERIGGAASGERAVLRLFEEKVPLERHFFEWCAEGVQYLGDPEAGNPEKFGAREWREQFVSGEPVVASHITELPRKLSSERERLERNGIRSVCAAPILDEHGAAFGLVGFATESFSNQWSSAEIEIVQTLAATVASALLRLRLEHRVHRTSVRLRETLDGTGAATWSWNVQTGSVTIDERWAEMLGYSVAELKPVTIETWKQLTEPGDLERAEVALQAHFEGRRERVITSGLSKVTVTLSSKTSISASYVSVMAHSSS